MKRCLIVAVTAFVLLGSCDFLFEPLFETGVRGVDGSDGVNGDDEGDGFGSNPGSPDSGTPTGAFFRFSFPTSGDALGDQTGNGNIASLGGNALVQGDSTNQYVELDGDDDYVRIQFASPFDPYDGLTFYAWVRPQSFSGQNIIMRTVWEEGTQFLRFSNDGTQIQFAASVNGYYEFGVPIDPSALLDGNWHQVAATFDGSVRRVYLDGAMIGAMDDSGVLGGGPFSEIYAGSFVDYPHYMEFFRGGLDDLRLYDTAMSSTQIESEYQSRVDGG